MISMMPINSGKLVLEKYEAIRIFLAYGGAYETGNEFCSKVLGRTVSKNVRYNDRHCTLPQKQILCLIAISNEVPQFKELPEAERTQRREQWARDIERYNADRKRMRETINMAKAEGLISLYEVEKRFGDGIDDEDMSQILKYF